MKKGFTLIELLVVIGIMLVLASAGLTAFHLLQPSWSLRSAVRDLTTDLRYAQQLAVTGQINHSIKFVAAQNKYQILKHLTPVELIIEKTLPGGVSFQAVVGFTNDEVIFNPYGAASESGTVSLINTEGNSRTVEVRPSGFVKIID